MKRALAILGVVAGAACDQGTTEAPAVAVAALEASGQQFLVEGPLRVSTCSVEGGTTTVTPRAVSGAALEARGNPSPTCVSLTGQALTDCIALVNTLRATPALSLGGPAAGDESYTLAPQQWILDGATPLPVSYWLAYDQTLRGPLVLYQGNSRYVHFSRPFWPFTAPATPGGTVPLPILSENMASYRLRLQYTPTLRDANGQLLASDRISAINLVPTVRINTPEVRTADHRFLYSCPAAGCPTDARPLDADAAAAESRFLHAPAIDGASGSPVTPEELVAELPLTPNDAGFYAGATYTVSLVVNFADGVRTILYYSLPTATVSACATIDQTLVITRPPSEINGSIVLRRDPAILATSPVVTHYAPTVREGVGAMYPVNISNDPTYTPTSTPETPHVFRWLGIPAGSYHVESPLNSSVDAAIVHGHALLTYPGRPALAWGGGGYLTAFRFPMNGSSTPDGAFALTEGDVDPADGQADDPVTLTIAGDMAYLEGELELVGCQTSAQITTGAADIYGSLERGVTEYNRGFSRGLFTPGTGDYLVAAIAGGWRERRYMLTLQEPGQDSVVFLEPAVPQAHTLTAGWDNRTTAAQRVYATSTVTITLSAEDAGGTSIQSRNPMLEINELSTFGAFDDPGTGTLLGAYYAVARRNDNAQALDHTLTITGFNSQTPVLVRPSVEVQAVAGGGWSRTSFPALEIMMAGEGGCDICVDSTVVPPATYTDDGQAPVVSAPSGVTLVEGTPTTTVTVTVTDFLAIRSVTANGIAMTAGPGPNEYTAVVPVTAATTSIAIVAQDLCRKTTTANVAVTFTADVCEAPLYDVCTDSAAGSVFYVTLLNAQSETCRLPCTTAGPDQAVVCDPDAITCAN